MHPPRGHAALAPQISFFALDFVNPLIDQKSITALQAYVLWYRVFPQATLLARYDAPKVN